MATWSVPATATSRERPQPRAADQSKPRAARFEEYRVAAGTALAIELRTTLSSATSRAADRVEGRLTRPLMAGDVELVPADAIVLGTVTEAAPATGRAAAHLSIAFTVIEHPETGSRATIRTDPLTFRSALPQRRQPLPAVTLPKGLDATTTLLQPLVVRIPVA